MLVLSLLSRLPRQVAVFPVSIRKRQSKGRHPPLLAVELRFEESGKNHFGQRRQA